MGKKHKAKLKEIERLRALYQTTSVANSTVEVAQATTVRTPATDGDVVTAMDDHNYIRRDIIGLVVLIIAMLVVLFGLSWVVQNTSFSSWLLGLFGV